MLSKKFRLPASDFRKLKRFGRSVPGKLFVTSYLISSRRRGSDELERGPRFGFVVSKALAKRATERNLIKRRLSEAVWAFIKSNPELVQSRTVDFCFIARKASLIGNYAQFTSEVNQVLPKILEL